MTPHSPCAVVATPDGEEPILQSSGGGGGLYRLQVGPSDVVEDWAAPPPSHAPCSR